MFSDILFSEMEKQNLSTYRLSKLSGIPESTIRNYRNDVSPTIDTAERLLGALGLKLTIRKIDK
jgi:transcriptional regulator with XRE-family HTH domain